MNSGHNENPNVGLTVERPVVPCAVPPVAPPFAPSAVPGTGPPAISPAEEIALLERRTEQAVLGSVLGALGAGRAAVVTLTGRPGQAQNALLRWAARYAEGSGLRVLRARAAPTERDLRHGVTVQLLTSRALPAGPPLRELAVRQSGKGDERRPGRRSEPLPGLDGLLRSARITPTLLAVEESQWLDPASLHWLHSLVRRLTPDTPVVVMASGSGVTPRGQDRPGLLPPSPVPVKHLVPRALSERGVAAAVELGCGIPGDQRFVAAVSVATAGSPTVLSDVLHRFTGRGYAPVAARLPELHAVMAAVLGDHAARVLRGLPDDATELLRAVAVCGGLLGFPLVRTLAGVRTVRGQRLRGTLEAAGLTVSTGQRTRVRCPAVMARVLEEMPAGQRADLYGRAAELAHRAGENDEDIARLLLGAPPLGAPWVVPVLHRGFAAAQRAEDHDRAVAQLSRALSEPLEPSERALLSLELASAEAVTAPEASDRRLAGLARADRRFRTVAAGPANTSATGVVARAIDLGLARGSGDWAREVAAEALSGDDVSHDRPPDENPLPNGPSRHQREALAALFWLADEDRDAMEPAVPEVPALPDRPVPPVQAGVRAWRLAARGEGPAAARALARAALAGRGPGADLVMPRLAACRALVLTDDCEEAGAELDTLLAAVRRDRLRAPAARVLATRAELHLHAGRLDAAEQDIADAERALPRESWHPLALPGLIGLRISTAMEAGRYEHAAALATAPVPPGAEEGAAWAVLLFARARVAAADGRWADARELSKESGRLLLRRRWANPALLAWRPLAAEAAHVLGDRAEAARLSAEEQSLARRWGTPSAVALAGLWTGPMTVADGGSGSGSGGAGDGGSGQLAEAREAVRVLRSTPARLSWLWGLFQLATAELEAGDREAAARSLAGLADFVAAHPSSRLARYAHRFTERLTSPGLPVSPSLSPSEAPSEPPAPPTPPARPQGWPALSAVERHTATLAGQGLGNREIAETLSVSRRTVELRLSNTYRKLRVTGRAELRAFVRTMEGHQADAS
ncbi:LuxR C-terminal-related transcriptional regulator [Streptomyces sp. NPDC088554]|uniref:LuxR C-terminal-related transcriptional regulator n=1 Tax=Streptomyces sp. NPDC088554 TaxID=3365865 RepID=UPI00382B45B4